MAEFVLIWVATIIATISMDVVMAARISKDLADQGYKPNLERFKELSEANPQIQKYNKIIKVIPGLNIMSELYSAVIYNNQKGLYLSNLNVQGAVEEMEDFEKEEYAKKPTSTNAFLMPIKTAIRLAKAITIKTVDDNETSELFYENNENGITVLKATGKYAKCSKSDNIKLIKSYNTICSVLRRNYENPEELIAEILRERKEEKVETPKEEKTEEPKRASFEDYKELAKNFEKEEREEEPGFQFRKDKKRTF